MQHKGTVTLTTERLILRRFEPGDAPAMFRNWASDPLVTRYMTWPPYTDVDGVRGYIDSVISKYDDPRTYDWMIVLKELGEPIGTIGVVEVQDHIDAVVIGYCIGHDFWGNGITAEAFSEIIRYLFDYVGVNRIEACHAVENPNSGRVMEKCGLQYEGTLRQGAKNNLGIYDLVVRAILRDDYLSEKEHE